MALNVKEAYKLQKSSKEEAYEYALALKNNEEYEKMVDQTFIEFMDLLKSTYPGIKIETPREREKSKKSIKNKIDKLEIERLCKLYAIGEITEQEKKDLYKYILNKIDINKKPRVKELLLNGITDLQQLYEIMEEQHIDNHIKTAILRIINTKLQNENKKELQLELDKKYGKKAAEESKMLKDDLLQWKCIENIDEKTREKLHSPFEYLKIKDIRGIRFVIADIPENINMQNEKLNQIIEKRKQARGQEKSKYNDLCCREITKDFANKLMQNEEWLEKLNIRIVTDGYKHKEKQNGYIAEHIKFSYINHPEYTFELQLRSIYREDISRVNGKAAHDKRSGKERNFPDVENKEEFIQELENTLPKYKVLEIKDGQYKLEKCNMIQNMLEYFLGYADFGNLDSEKYLKAIEYIKQNEEKEQNIK